MFTRCLIAAVGKCFVFGLLVATLTFAIPGRAFADPVPIQSSIPVFCFRITDIERVAPGSNKFRIEFEVLNWTQADAHGIYIALNEGTGVGTVSGNPPSFAGASIDPDGRPLVLIDVNGDGVINDFDLEDTNDNGLLDPGEDINGNGRLDNDPIPGNLNPLNDWTVISTTTAITWSSGTSVPGIDLTGFLSGSPLQPGDLQIAFMQFINLADPSSVIPETIDNGPNVLDGFVITVDDFDPGEILSFNWFLTDANGQIINDPEIGTNPYGFGVVNLTSLAGATFPSPVFSGNTGFSQSPKLFFDSVYVVPNPAQFAAEFGAAMTAAFLNLDDNLFNIPVTTQLLNRLDVTPRTATNSVGTDHTVAATLTDGQHNPVSGQTVEFRVSGANSATGQGTTDTSGQATFTYTGTNAGEDTITAWVDENGNSVQDPAEPFDVVIKTWVSAEADLAITKADLSDPVRTGDHLTYRLEVTNHGPSDATGVTATDPLPAGVAFVSATPSQGMCAEASNVVTCHLGDLANGTHATVMVVVTPTAGGTITNTAHITGNEPDPHDANNTASASTTVILGVPIDIKPGGSPNPINPTSRGTIPVAILSMTGFDAPSEVDKTSLTFGRTGDEASLAFCNKNGEDVNRDGLRDLVCHFHTQLTGFQVGDVEGILKGKTVNGISLEGRDSVRIVPPK